MPRKFLRYIYGEPVRPVRLVFNIDADLDAKLGTMAYSCRWRYANFLRYLLILGLHQFRIAQCPEEQDVGTIDDGLGGDTDNSGVS